MVVVFDDHAIDYCGYLQGRMYYKLSHLAFEHVFFISQPQKFEMIFFKRQIEITKSALCSLIFGILHY